MRGVRRGIAAAAGLGVLLAGILMLGPPSDGLPYDPSSSGDAGLLGLVRLLGEFDVEVSVTPRLPTDTSARVFVPADQQSDERRARLRAFAEAGGTVVVAGDTSLHDLEVAGGSFVDVIGRTEREPACAALEQVGTVRHDGWDGFVVPDSATACFPLGGDASWLVVTEVGEGAVIALGSPEPFTNALLAEADNAVLAAALFGPEPGGELVVVPRGPVGQGSTPLLELVPDGVVRALWLLGAALLVGVVWRARRLGPPVQERLPPVLPSAQLARSLADLLQRAGDRDAAADRIREDLRRDARAVLGLPTQAPPAVLVERLVRMTDVDPADAERVFAATAVPDDAELTALGAAAARVRAALHHGRAYGAPDPRAVSVTGDPTPDPRAVSVTGDPTPDRTRP